MTAAWQVIAGLILVAVVELVFWDAFLRGRRSRHAVAIATIGAAIVALGGLLQAMYGGPWILLGLLGLSLVALAKRIDRPDARARD